MLASPVPCSVRMEIAIIAKETVSLSFQMLGERLFVSGKIVWMDAIEPIRSAAQFASVLSTDCRSNVERLMTFRTSAVAVCCWSDSCNSETRRAFSIATTA